jgi:hypothetical protein
LEETQSFATPSGKGEATAIRPPRAVNRKGHVMTSQIFTLRLRPETDDDGEAIRMLRLALKFLKRELKLKCLSIDSTERSPS